MKTLFDTHPTIRPHFADPEDTPRLGGQNAAILARLRVGPATNSQLVGLSLNYTARISDVRDWLRNNTGQTITCERHEGGLSIYRIEKI